MANPGEQVTDVALTEDRLIVTWLTVVLSRCRWLGSQGFYMQPPRSVTTGRLQGLATESTGQKSMRT